jgi:hypothetical protein
MVTFKSKAGRNVDYHTTVGLQLLKMMGRDSKLPSAMFADDVPEALVRLQQALQNLAEEESSQHEHPADDMSNDENDKPAQVNLTVRAKPLLELLQKAQEANVGVMWA